MRSAIPRAIESVPSVAMKRIDFQPRVEKSVGKAAGESRQKAAEEADGLAAGVAHQHGCDDRGKTDDRTHGKIDAAGDDDQGLPQGDDRHDRGLAADVQQVARLQEIIAGECQIERHDGEHGKHRCFAMAPQSSCEGQC
jgi:hypothetical protein